ncbi:PAQR family membrane homeostasis protein TrhA [Algoriphagus namhaensis]
MKYKAQSTQLPRRIQTPREEKFNALTHGFGLLLALIGSPILLAEAFQRGNFDLNLATISFSLGMLMVYASSTFYHLAKDRRLKQKLQKADHISIYFLIAGSYSPMLLAVLPREKALIWLSLLWAFVLVGTIFKVFFIGRFKFVSVGLYLMMGWISVFLLRSMWQNLSGEILTWIALGGLGYTAGVYFYINSKRLYFHAIWHLFVLVGTASHFIAIARIISDF